MHVAAHSEAIYVAPKHYDEDWKDQLREHRGETSDTRKLLAIIRRIEFIMEEISLPVNFIAVIEYLYIFA